MVLPHQEDEVDILVPPNSVATLSVAISTNPHGLPHHKLLSLLFTTLQISSATP